MPMVNGKIDSVRTLNRLNQSTQIWHECLRRRYQFKLIAAVGRPGNNSLNRLKICPTDLRPVCMDVRTTAIDERSIVVKFEEINLKVQKVRKSLRCNEVRKSSRSTVTVTHYCNNVFSARMLNC